MVHETKAKFRLPTISIAQISQNVAAHFFETPFLAHVHQFHMKIDWFRSLVLSGTESTCRTGQNKSSRLKSLKQKLKNIIREGSKRHTSFSSSYPFLGHQRIDGFVVLWLLWNHIQHQVFFVFGDGDHVQQDRHFSQCISAMEKKKMSDYLVCRSNVIFCIL